jgi:ABC-type multidrug transport system fused ATPase/permease subunit
LQRFYDLESGRLCVNNHGIQAVNLASLRAGLGLVSQEPVLFNRYRYHLHWF